MALTTPTLTATADDGNARVLLVVDGLAAPAVAATFTCATAAAGFNFGGANDLDFDLTVDGGSVQNVNVNTDVTDMAGLVSALNTATTGCTWSSTDGLLVCTSDTTGASSTLEVAAVTDGGGGNVSGLTVQDVAGSADPAQLFQVERSDDGGTTYTEVRFWGDQTPDGSYIVSFYDYEAPGRGTVKYRAKAVDNYNGLNADSAYTTVATITADVHGWWIQDPQVPALNTTVIANWQELNKQKPVEMGVFTPLGRTRKVAVYGDTRGWEFPVEFFCNGDAAFTALTSVVTNGRVVLLRADTGDLWYMAPGSLTVKEPPGAARDDTPIRLVSVPFVEVDIP